MLKQQKMTPWPNPYITPKQLAVTLCGLVIGGGCIGVGAHLSYVNIEPQQARAKARKDYIKARLRKLLED